MIDPLSYLLLGGLTGYAIGGKPQAPNTIIIEGSDGRNAEGITFPSEAEFLEMLRHRKPTLFSVVPLDTSEARNMKEYPTTGFSIFVQNPADASLPVYIQLNEADSPLIDITKIQKIITPFYRFFITNAAGVGTLTLLIGKTPAFKVFEPLIANASVSAPAYVTPSNGGVNVTVASTLILAANANRLYAVIINDSDTDMWLGIGVAAVAHKGIRLNAEGGAYEIGWSNLYVGAVYGIHEASGNKVATFMEGS